MIAGIFFSKRRMSDIPAAGYLPEVGENKINFVISSSVTGDGRPFRRFNRQACGQISYFIYKCIIQRRVFPKIEISSQDDFSSFSFSFSDVIKKLFSLTFYSTVSDIFGMVRVRKMGIYHHQLSEIDLLISLS